MCSDISIAGISSDHTDAATITPAAKPKRAYLYVEFTAMERMQNFIRLLKDRGIQIYDVEIDRRGNIRKENIPSVVFYLHLPKYQSHTRLLADLSYSPDVRTIDEI